MKSHNKIIGFLAVLGFLLVSVTPASAAQPPEGYPTQKIMYIVKDRSGHTYPVRLGFFDHAKNVGFGKDKVQYKHNIKNSTSVKFVVNSPNVSFYKTQYTYFAYANKIECSGSRCKVTDSRRVRAVMDRAMMSKKHGWPVNGNLGLMTMYCDNPNKEWPCPSWADLALSNAYKSTMGRAAMTPTKARSNTVNAPETVYEASYEPMKVGSTIAADEILGDE